MLLELELCPGSSLGPFVLGRCIMLCVPCVWWLLRECCWDALCSEWFAEYQLDSRPWRQDSSGCNALYFICADSAFRA